MAIIGRLKPGVPIGSAQAEMKTLAEQITHAHPERNDFEGKITPLAEHVSGRIRPALLVLACAVGSAAWSRSCCRRNPNRALCSR